MNQYTKAIVAGIVSIAVLALGAYSQAQEDGPLSATEWIAIVILVLNGVLVWFFPNAAPPNKDIAGEDHAPS